MTAVDFAAGDDGIWSLDLGDGIRVRGTLNPGSPVLDRFFEGYDRAFVLPDEREKLEGFRDCLALNASSRHRFGRLHAELVIVLEDGDGTLLGGANFLSTLIAPAPEGHPEVAVALNYVFVEAAARGRGLSRRILEAVARLANRSLERADDAGRPALFIEQNDPLRMTVEDYERDTAHAGIDQIDRMMLWARLGAHMVNFAYVQPALSADQEPDDGLVYSVINFPGDAIDPLFLRDHFESFFGISVLKGADPTAEPVAAAQLAQLDAMAASGDTVAVRSVDAALTRLKASPTRPAGLSFREFTLAG